MRGGKRELTEGFFKAGAKQREDVANVEFALKECPAYVPVDTGRKGV